MAALFKKQLFFSLEAENRWFSEVGGNLKFSFVSQTVLLLGSKINTF